MFERIWIAPHRRPFFPGEGETTLHELADVLGMDLESHRRRTRVSRSGLVNPIGETVEVYLKVYASRAHPLHGAARRSRAALEARNLMNFQQWGIRAPEVLAWGIQRRAAGLCSDLSFLVTRAVPDAPALRDFWTGLAEPASDTRRGELIDQLARQTRVLHQHHFFHQDLKWRNLLVDAESRIHWIDCPNGYFSRLPWRRRHGRIKDLATLDKVAKDRCREEERRRFLRVYLDTDDEKKISRWARAVVRYRKRRQD